MNFFHNRSRGIKILAILCAELVLAAGLWFILNQSNGLLPVDQIHSMTITKYDVDGEITVTVTETAQLRYLAGKINALRLEPVNISAGLLPEYRLVFLDAAGQPLTQLRVFDSYLIANEHGAFQGEIPNQNYLYSYLRDLIQGKSIPVQDPELALAFLAGLGLLLVLPFCSGICFIAQLMVCRATERIELRWLPIAATVVFCLICRMGNNIFNFIPYLFISALRHPGFDPILWILFPLCMLFHYLGWRAGDATKNQITD